MSDWNPALYTVGPAKCVSDLSWVRRRYDPAHPRTPGPPTRWSGREFAIPDQARRWPPAHFLDRTGSVQGLGQGEWPRNCRIGSLERSRPPKSFSFGAPLVHAVVSRGAWDGRSSDHDAQAWTCIRGAAAACRSAMARNSQRRLNPPAQLTACSASPTAPCSQQRSIR
jgi:hypothetical protein